MVPAKTALELAEIRSLYTEEQHGISLGHSAASPRNQDSLECLQGRGSPLTTPGLFSKIRHCWPALSNSENLAIICQTKEKWASERGREGGRDIIIVQLWCQLICNNVTVAGGQGWGSEIRRQADGGQTALILLLSNETISEPNFYQQDVPGSNNCPINYAQTTERWNFSALDKLVPFGQTYANCDTLSSCRSQKLVHFFSAM